MEELCESCIYPNSKECSTCTNSTHDIGTADKNYHLSDHYVFDYRDADFFDVMEDSHLPNII